MQTSSSTCQFSLRPATASDAGKIRQIIIQVRINPTGLNWRRFIVAVDQRGTIVGCGQVKSHAGELQELASLAVLPEWRGHGVARSIVEQLIQQYPGALYLTCRARLEPLYQKFGFQSLEVSQMPPFYRRLSKVAALFNRLFRRSEHLSVMRRDH